MRRLVHLAGAFALATCLSCERSTPPTTSPESGSATTTEPTPTPEEEPLPERFAKELKRRGWRFFGPTTAYAFMQSEGLTNDHEPGCFAFEPCEAERRAFLAGRELRD